MSFLRRQVMDYKEQMKQANENNAFMIHNGVRAVELSETAARVEMDPENPKGCRVTVPDNQLSLAIGNKGQNVRLCAHLTGYNIDIRPESGYYGEDEE